MCVKQTIRIPAPPQYVVTVRGRGHSGYRACYVIVKASRQVTRREIMKGKVAYSEEHARFSGHTLKLHYMYHPWDDTKSLARLGRPTCHVTSGRTCQCHAPVRHRRGLQLEGGGGHDFPTEASDRHAGTDTPLIWYRGSGCVVSSLRHELPFKAGGNSGCPNTSVIRQQPPPTFLFIFLRLQEVGVSLSPPPPVARKRKSRMDLLPLSCIFCNLDQHFKVTFESEKRGGSYAIAFSVLEIAFPSLYQASRSGEQFAGLGPTSRARMRELK
ncbi:hypothetical protein Bbelb_125650 [Branchiostoma belcheri]|nr:hypothetical protein Bbelb_125650 [Branchiostoma belcheri]